MRELSKIHKEGKRNVSTQSEKQSYCRVCNGSFRGHYENHNRKRCIPKKAPAFSSQLIYAKDVTGSLDSLKCEHETLIKYYQLQKNTNGEFDNNERNALQFFESIYNIATDISTNQLPNTIKPPFLSNKSELDRLIAGFIYCAVTRNPQYLTLDLLVQGKDPIPLLHRGDLTTDTSGDHIKTLESYAFKFTYNDKEYQLNTGSFHLLTKSYFKDCVWRHNYQNLNCRRGEIYTELEVIVTENNQPQLVYYTQNLDKKREDLLLDSIAYVDKLFIDGVMSPFATYNMISYITTILLRAMINTLSSTQRYEPESTYFTSHVLELIK